MDALPSPATFLARQIGADVPKVGARPTAAQARRVAEEFESVFLAQFTSIMFSSVKSEGPFGGGPTEDIFKSLLAQEYGKTLARAGGFGVADSVYREILRSQEIE